MLDFKNMLAVQHVAHMPIANYAQKACCTDWKNAETPTNSALQWVIIGSEPNVRPSLASCTEALTHLLIGVGSGSDKGKAAASKSFFMASEPTEKSSGTAPREHKVCYWPESRKVDIGIGETKPMNERVWLQTQKLGSMSALVWKLVLRSVRRAKLSKLEDLAKP